MRVLGKGVEPVGRVMRVSLSHSRRVSLSYCRFLSLRNLCVSQGGPDIVDTLLYASLFCLIRLVCFLVVYYQCCSLLLFVTSLLLL